MGGGLMQLVAYGAQDVYLTGNPQITFFKVVYRRHTNFSMETVEHSLNGNPQFGNRANVTITRNGDLVHRMYLRIVLNKVTASAGQFAWVRRLGHALLDEVEVEVCGSRIDRQFGNWLNIWYELTHTNEKDRGYAAMIGDHEDLTTLEGSRGDTANTIKDEYTLFIPLQFWFNRNAGLALPLIALQYHEVRLLFTFRALAECVVMDRNFTTLTSSGASMKEVTLLVDYVYLDSEERRRFAQVGHEYLIEQLQHTNAQSVTNLTGQYRLDFNHPCKEIIWAMINGNFDSGKWFLAYTHLDSWATAITDAAESLASSMFVLSAYDASTGAPGAGDWVQVTGAAGSSNTLNVKNGTGTGNITITIGSDVDLVGTEDASGNPLTNPTYELWVLRNALLECTNVNLGAKLSAVTINTTGVTVTTHTLTIRDLSFPISEMTDTRLTNSDVKVYQWFNYGLMIDGTLNPVSTALIQLNGHDRFKTREGAYFNYVQPEQHHTRTPADGINVYSFALYPEQHQPSGTANLSRIDNTLLTIYFADASAVGAGDSPCTLNFYNSLSKIWIYAINYNVLRIMSGMGGLAYSN